MKNILPNPPEVIVLSDDVLKDIYADNEVNYFASVENNLIV